MNFLKLLRMATFSHFLSSQALQVMHTQRENELFWLDPDRLSANLSVIELLDSECNFDSDQTQLHLPSIKHFYEYGNYSA